MFPFSGSNATAVRGSTRIFTSWLVLATFFVVRLHATEYGTSAYPAGVETVLPGLAPPPGVTMFETFSNFYQSNQLADAQGHSLVPGFHLRVGAVAVKVVHNWGVHFLGGSLVSTAALPFLYEHLNTPFGAASKSGFGNPDIGVVSVAYQRKAWHWWYGMDVYTPSFSYNKNDILNVGQHNFAIVPDGAFTYLSEKGRTELSSRFQYIVNYANPVTNYRSGHEFIWEYDGMRHIAGAVSAGANGYLYLQTTDDLQSGLVAGNGNRGRVFAIGPEVRAHLKHYALILKYQKEMLAQNKTVGNSFWFELGVPLGHPKRD